MATLRLIIAGSRGFRDFQKLEREVLNYLKVHKKKGDVVEILSGTARGADKLGEVFAKKYGLKVHPFHADWEIYGKKAGRIRNVEMAKEATHCIVFWDGISRGAHHMACMAEKNGLKLKVCTF